MTPWPCRDIVALSLCSSLTAADVIAMAGALPTLEDAFDVLPALPGMQPCDALRDGAEQALRRAEVSGTDVITFFDDRYPERLRTIPAPPAMLWVQGALPPRSVPAVAVVGTRSCTASYGKPVTDTLTEAWVRAGCCIVSGLAAGVDTVAHERTLRSGGTTVAVIASGTDRISPSAAATLAKRIVDGGGAIVSEYRCGVAALPPYFPQRNRIIAGLADAVVVTESAAKGGALITAEFARRLQRPLYAVPGSILSSRSTGTNALLAAGLATMCVHADDVLASIGITAQQTMFPLAASLTPRQSAIVSALDGDDIHVDTLARHLNVDVGTVLSEMLALELTGAVVQTSPLRYAARKSAG
ncbi:MAG: DNA-processing protein DprA [Candidatus Kapabacteria bacterium]|nr:DNA-processing protein DprA [Candidatus Kapabacteria bacterium]